MAASLRSILELCSSLDFDVVAQWRPREELAVEDALSRVADASDWGLAPLVLGSIFREFGRPSIDLFASDVWHVATSFVNPHYMSECAAVDALRRDWKELVLSGDRAWIFAPVRAIPQAIRMLKDSRIEAILIVPEAPTTNWWPELNAMKGQARNEGPIVLDRSTDICIPSRRVPHGTLNPALFKLRVFRISWSA
jgi:hypothetical protein